MTLWIATLLQCGFDTHSCHLAKLFVKYQLSSQVLEWNLRNVILFPFNSSLDTIPSNLVSGSPQPGVHCAPPEADPAWLGWAVPAGRCPAAGCVTGSSARCSSAIKILCHENDHARIQIDEGHLLLSCNILGNSRKEM